MRWLIDVVLVVFGEVLVLSPILVLTLGVIPSLERSKAERSRGIDLPALSQSLNTYRAKWGHYPASLQSLVDVGILDKLFTDPWERPYLYERRSGLVYLGSLGKDGLPGGVDLNADFECWMSNEVVRSALHVGCY